MKKLILLIFFFVFGCDRTFIVPLNGDREKSIATECGTIKLSLETLGHVHFSLSCSVIIDSAAVIWPQRLKIRVNGNEVNYQVWRNGKRVALESLAIIKKDRLEYSFSIPRGWEKVSPISEIKILAEQYLQVDSKVCGFEPITVPNVR